jgi:hypothetical protein
MDKVIEINSRDFDGDSVWVRPDVGVTVDDVVDFIEARVLLDGADVGTTEEGGRWYLTTSGHQWDVYAIDLDAVIDRGHYYGGIEDPFNEEGSAQDALAARRAKQAM